jgi:hypothetical protein
MKLITEISKELVINESKSKGTFITGIFSSAEIKNNNGRIYKKQLLEREITKIIPKVEKKCLWGELGHPPNPEVNPDKIAILTTMLEWKNNDVYGKSKVLDTPFGNILKTLVKEGRMGISSRGLGTVGEDGYVNEDFSLLVYDAVTDPSNNPSWVKGIFEAKDFNIIEDPKEREKEIDEHLTILQNFAKASKSKIFKALGYDKKIK